MAIAQRAFSPHLVPMKKPTKSRTSSPSGFKRPEHWTNEPPPEPEKARPNADPDGLDPTRFGDWVKNGIAVDF
ncbi:DUF1674 domain-containing protein [Novosphingobium sp. ZN18A2]|uniref:DUF1674 domain-containing protein n=1 Tax=Novosphingobium sp. ZN18A2 TaxID=3079861 RepID=UPI0030D31397